MDTTEALAPWTYGSQVPLEHDSKWNPWASHLHPLSLSKKPPKLYTWFLEKPYDDVCCYHKNMFLEMLPPHILRVHGSSASYSYGFCSQ